MHSLQSKDVLEVRAAGSSNEAQDRPDLVSYLFIVTPSSSSHTCRPGSPLPSQLQVPVCRPGVMQRNIYTLWGTNMTTSSRTCPVPAVNGHMTHYPAAPYPLLFPPVIGGLSLPSLHGLQSHPPTSGCSTPSPASKCLPLIAFISLCFPFNKSWARSFCNRPKSHCSCPSVVYLTWAKSVHLFWKYHFHLILFLWK